MSTGSRGGGGKRFRPMAEINVTPMVDVMLVLLIIFMVTAPLLQTGVKVDLPDSKTQPLTQSDNKPLVVTVNASGQIFLGSEERVTIPIEALAAKLKAIIGSNPDPQIYVRGDAAADYGKVMKVLGALYDGGFTKASLITQPVKSGG